MISLFQARRLAFFNFLVFLCYLVLNIVSELNPINGVTTLQLRHEALNYLVPDALTFRIRPILFAVLLLNSIYMLVSVYRSNIDSINFLQKIHPLFSFAVLLQPLWLLAFHARENFIAQFILLVICINVIVMQLRMLEYSRRYFLTAGKKFLLMFPPQLFTGWMFVVTIAGFAHLFATYGWDDQFPGQFILNVALLALLAVYFLYFVFRGAIVSTLPVLWYLYRLMNSDLSLLVQHRLFLSLVHMLLFVCLSAYVVYAFRRVYIRAVSY